MTIVAMLAFWVLAGKALFSRTNFYVYFPWLMLPFGAFAVVPPSVTLGSTLLPITVARAIFLLRIASIKGGTTIMWKAATDLKALGFFALFAVYAVISAYAIPRVLQGLVYVLPLRMTVIDALVPLAPTSANITQPVYVVFSFLFALGLVAYLKLEDSNGARTHLTRAVYCSAAILVMTGLIDFVGGKAVLDIFRNGTYAIIGYTNLGGVTRITGAFSESSIFAMTTASLCTAAYFLRPTLEAGRLKNPWSVVITWALFILTLRAGSSTGYAGLVAFAGCVGLHRLRELVVAGRIPRSLWIYGLAAVGLLLVLISIVAAPHAFDRVETYLNDVVFNKSKSQSFSQRSYWTHRGYETFWNTWWLGAGAGSNRVSSWFSAIAGDTGIIGILCMGGQVIVIFLANARNKAALADQWAAKSLLAVTLATMYINGMALDPGPFLSLSFAFILCASTWSVTWPNTVPALSPTPRTVRPRRAPLQQS